VNPYAAWLALPPPFKSFIISALWSLNTFVGTCVAAWLATGGRDFASFVSYMAANWFILVTGFLYGAGASGSFRASQAARATLPSSPPKGQ